MKVEVGDRVTYPSVYSSGRVLIKGGIGEIVAIKQDYFGKSSRRIAVVQAGKNRFDVFLDVLERVNRGGSKL